MFVLGLQGSPRKNGNTNYLLSSFLREVGDRGAQTCLIHVPEKDIKPCIGCAHCETKGLCAIVNDDMSKEIYYLLRRAEVVIIATPIYFYHATAQLKKFIDRCQALWARKYKLGLADPRQSSRKGILLAVGATKGKNLFEGMSLTAKYVFDAIGADYSGSLTYRRIEEAGDMAKHPTVAADIQKEVDRLSLMLNRKKVLFVCRQNACRSQMAAAFAQSMAGDKIDALCAGSQPAQTIDPMMESAMQEIGLDLAFRKPRSLDDALSETKPHMIVTMGCREECSYIQGTTVEEWDLPDPAGKPIDFMRNIRDEIRQRVKDLMESV